MSDVEEIAHAIAGAGGGALSMIVTYPLVTLSTLAQTTQKKKKLEENGALAGKDTSSVSAKDAKEIHYKLVSAIVKSSSYQAAQTIIQEKGVLGLYSGLESALYGITLTNFIYYYFYELTSNVFLRANSTGARKGKGLSTLQSIATGAVAGALTCVGSNPFWVANTRMMTNKKKSDGNGHDEPTSSTFATLLDIVQTDGFGTLFAGVFPALVLVLNPIIQYTIFEQIKNAIVAKTGKSSFTPVKAFFIGAFGKLIATTLTYPYITLKSRMHVKKKKLASELGEEKEIQLSMVQEIKKIIHEEGLDGLYGGLIVKLIQSISTAAFLFYFKEELLVGSVKLVELFRFLRVKKQIQGK
ncbi:peroxisomal adenine nucleotide transporter 1 [[Candida] railenensis]|uniref:Mitochondrial thiamine pyrophosphate carrier 1 n=1 Tax=[Candida] railenensis TaxID=45579 RepID=A0A9P0QME2_9ASCO|nr:peroxisomal adenine nucleotide transporter 1 [[Candida] railenensis]